MSVQPCCLCPTFPDEAPPTSQATPSCHRHPQEVIPHNCLGQRPRPRPCLGWLWALFGASSKAVAQGALWPTSLTPTPSLVRKCLEKWAQTGYLIGATLSGGWAEPWSLWGAQAVGCGSSKEHCASSTFWVWRAQQDCGDPAWFLCLFSTVAKHSLSQLSH